MERRRTDRKTNSGLDAAGVGRQRPPRPQDSPRLVQVLGHRGLLTVSGDREQRVATIARMQRGLVTRRQLLAAGLASTTITNMINRGLLRTEHSGVYAVAYAPPVSLMSETAALLACHGRAVLSHRSAAALWGLTPARDGPVDVTALRADRGRRRAGIRSHRTAELIARDVATCQGLPVTSPARTLLDLSSYVSVGTIERALDEALVVLEIVRPAELEDVVARAGSRAGSRVLREALADPGGGTLTESEAERRFLELIRKAGLPLPESQVPFDGYRIDFLWRDAGVVFEVDGHRYHSSRSAFNRGRRKDAALKSAGLDPNHVTRDEIEFRPLAVIALVAAALARRSAQQWAPEGPRPRAV